jgi:hypothetical protein
MKKVIFLIIFMPLPVYCQIFENFESGYINNWVQSAYGRWKADMAGSISGSWSLHHAYDNPDAGVDQIGIPLGNLKPSMGLTRWSFIIKYGYDPSSSNNWSIFLLSDSEPSDMMPGGKVNGFALGVNLTGYDDSLRLWEVQGNNTTVVINTGINWQTDIGISNAMKIYVERSQTGVWSVSVNHINDSPLTKTTGEDTDLFNSGWFGVYYKYSSTRDRLLWLDDIKIEGVFFEDFEPPRILRCDLAGTNSVRVAFDETPSYVSVKPGNFSLIEGDNKSKSVIKESELLFRIEFDNNLINKTISTLMINSLCDISGNCVNNMTFPFTPVWAETGDILISEIMADPLPVVSLPEKEYFEITNVTNYPYNLKNWKLSSADQNVLLTERIIMPGEIIIVCPVQDTSLFLNYGRVTGLKQFPNLTDKGKLIFISDSSNNLIHGVEYSSGWYGDGLKDEGGWSLEMIDTKFPFYQEGNWIASISRTGGTPGKINSVSQHNPDNSFSGIQNVFPDDSVIITVRFSETVKNFFENFMDITIGGIDLINGYLKDPLLREFGIKIKSPLLRGQLYTLIIPDAVTDFAGNQMQKNSFVFGLPEPAEKDNIMFNELMFNALPGDPDYIELYNCSDKIIDASRLYLVSVDDAAGDTSGLKPVSIESRCIMPNTYYTITTDKKKVAERFYLSVPDNIFEIESLPSMIDEKGHLLLLNRELDKIDEVYYNEEMHYSLLAGYEGVALEKLRPQMSSNNPFNWHSASEASGWGTPGTANSIFVEIPYTDDNVLLSSGRITPDNDGYEDYLIIDLNLKGNGNIVSIKVFNEMGVFIRKLADNMLAGTKASVIWDGTTESGILVNTGIYIIFITIFDDTGKTKSWKKVCTVLRE